MSAGTNRPSQQQVDLLLRRLKEVAPGFDNDFLIDILEQSGWDINRAIDEAIFMCVGAEGSVRPGLQPSNASVIAQNAISRGFISPSIQYAAAAPRVQKTELQQIQEAHQHIVSQLRQTPSSGGLRRIDPSEDPHTVFEQLRKGLPASPAPQQDRLFQQYASQAHRAEAPRVSPEEAQERFAREKRAAEEREQAARAAARAAEEQTAQRVSELTRLLEIQKRESEVEKQRVQLLEQQIAVQRAEQEAKLRELALIEEEQRRAQLERQREALAVESVIAKEQPAELVIIYYNSEATESEKADIDVIRGIFQAERIPSNQIAVRDYTGDAALTATIRQHSVTATRTHASPMVYIRNNPVGNLEDCRKLIADQQHHVLLATTDTPPLPSDSDHALSLAFGSSVLNAGSVTVRAVGSALWAPVTAFKWLIGSTDPQLEEGVSFDVVRSNQWSREQHRIIRFTDTKILRIDPSNNTVREEATYDEVAGVISVDANNIIIRYKDETKHYPDYLRAMRVDIIRMKVLFNEKSQGRIRIFDPTEPLDV